MKRPGFPSWQMLAGAGRLRFVDGKGFPMPICFFVPPKRLCPEYMIRILNVIHIIYIYTWIHEAFSMWTY